MSKLNKPQWQLPPGVSRGTWDYLQAKHIASDYDTYFADSALMQLDLSIVRQHLPPLGKPSDAIAVGALELPSSPSQDASAPPRIADLGCGTGRMARQLLPLGYRMLNVDLSPAMLAEARASISSELLDRCEFQSANLVELDQQVPPCSVDLAVCLFSSIGMIRKRTNRIRFLKGTRQMLTTDGKFILHVHNRHASWFDPGGPQWLLSSWWNSLLAREAEFGDRVYAYRGLPKMFLHIYSRRELVQDLREAGFSKLQILPIAPAGDRLLHPPERASWLSWLRAGGFFAICSQ